MARKHIDPIAQLMKEHEDALVHLSSLQKATHAIASDGFAPQHFKTVLSALEFIEEEVSVHNKSEEEALFPVLERYVEGPTVLMRKDHKEMRKEFVKLRKAVSKLSRNKRSTAAAAELETISKVIIQRFVNHIHKENHILFPLVQKFLTKDALREVARRMV
jgi:hemerythrin-like domain-containing protein